MTENEARQLKKGDVVITDAGDVYVFIELDEDCDLKVECQIAKNGCIFVYRSDCYVVMKRST